MEDVYPTRTCGAVRKLRAHVNVEESLRPAADALERAKTTRARAAETHQRAEVRARGSFGGRLGRRVPRVKRRAPLHRFLVCPHVARRSGECGTAENRRLRRFSKRARVGRRRTLLRAPPLAGTAHRACRPQHILPFADSGARSRSPPRDPLARASARRHCHARLARAKPPRTRETCSRRRFRRAPEHPAEGPSCARLHSPAWPHAPARHRSAQKRADGRPVPSIDSPAHQPGVGTC